MFNVHFSIGLASLAGYVMSQTSTIDYVDTPPLVVQVPPYLGLQGTTYSWIGSETSYVPTESTFPVTSSGTTTTTTTSLEYSVATATADTSNDKVGDVSVIISPKLRTSLTNAAVKHCAGGAKKRNLSRRSLSSCGLNFAADAVSDPGFLVEPPRLPTVKATDIANIIQKGVAAGRILASQKGAATIALIALAAWLASSASSNDRSIPNALKIPASDISKGVPSSTTPSSESCTSKPTVVCIMIPKEVKLTISKSPICDDVKNCNGLKRKICQTTGWTVTSDQIKDPRDKFCEMFSDSSLTVTRDSQTCEIDFGGDSQNGNVNDPTPGNAVGLTWGKDPDNDACADVPLDQIKFSVDDCKAAFTAITSFCRPPALVGAVTKTQGGRDGINCAMYGYTGGIKGVLGAPCTF
ncbi:MAG: hypothetical protein Q9227_001999 [Pyrenula ochraceoflavens]